MTTIKFRPITAAVALLSISPASYAFDEKTYPGSFCEELLSEDPISHGVEVVCPIIRDNTDNTNGLKAAFVRIYNQFGLIECTLYSARAGGSLVATKRASTDLSGVRSLNVTVKASAKKGTYNMHCVLPCLAGRDQFCDTHVIGYRVVEY